MYANISINNTPGQPFGHFRNFENLVLLSIQTDLFTVYDAILAGAGGGGGGVGANTAKIIVNVYGILAHLEPL